MLYLIEHTFVSILHNKIGTYLLNILVHKCCICVQIVV
nr:MAG TPA: hypothetical protein [Caudoviricetes sp.]